MPRPKHAPTVDVLCPRCRTRICTYQRPHAGAVYVKVEPARNVSRANHNAFRLTCPRSRCAFAQVLDGSGIYGGITAAVLVGRKAVTVDELVKLAHRALEPVPEG